VVTEKRRRFMTSRGHLSDLLRKYCIWNSPAACFAFARAVAVKRWSFKSVSVFDKFGNESESGREGGCTANETTAHKTRSVEYFAPLYYSHGTSIKRHLPNNPPYVFLS